MIKLQDILTINDIKYSDKIKPKHQKKMNMETTILDDVKVPDNPFPENSSKETRDELQWLMDYNNGVLDKKYSKDGDDVLKVFEDYCKENDLEFNKSYYDKLLKESSKTILQLKYHYNRPRPYQLAEYFGVEDFGVHRLDSGNTPAYPSGHTTQAHIMCLMLGDKYPKHYSNLKELANTISKSRLMARIHYPSDCVFGEKVAMYIVGAIND